MDKAYVALRQKGTGVRLLAVSLDYHRIEAWVSSYTKTDDMQWVLVSGDLWASRQTNETILITSRDLLESIAQAEAEANV